MADQEQESPRTPRMDRKHLPGVADLSEYSPGDVVLFTNIHHANNDNPNINMKTIPNCASPTSGGSLHSVYLTPVKVRLEAEEIEPAPNPPVFSLLSAFNESASEDVAKEERGRFAATLLVAGVFAGVSVNVVSLLGTCFVRRKYYMYYMAGCVIGAIGQTGLVLLAYFYPFIHRALLK